MEIADDDWETAWACFNCTPRQGESFDSWVVRAKAEYQATLHPVGQSAWEAHGGHGLKPKTV